MSEESRLKWLNCEDEQSKVFLEKYSKEEILRMYRRSLLWQVETENFIIKEAEKVIDKKILDGDEFGPITMDAIVEMLVKEIIELRKK